MYPIFYLLKGGRIKEPQLFRTSRKILGVPIIRIVVFGLYIGVPLFRGATICRSLAV